MALTIQKNLGADAPKVDDGLVLLRFDNIREKTIDAFKTESDNFGNPDDGSRYIFDFTLLDEDGKVTYQDDDAVVLEGMTKTATGEKSNFYAKFLKGLLTKTELALFDTGEPFDAEAVKGRIVNGIAEHSEKSGWPRIASVVGISKKKAS